MKELFEEMGTETKVKDDAKLYKTISSIVETLRSKNYSESDIEGFVLSTVKQIVNEQ